MALSTPITTVNFTTRVPNFTINRSVDGMKCVKRWWKYELEWEPREGRGNWSAKVCQRFCNKLPALPSIQWRRNQYSTAACHLQPFAVERCPRAGAYASEKLCDRLTGKTNRARVLGTALPQHRKKKKKTPQRHKSVSFGEYTHRPLWCRWCHPGDHSFTVFSARQVKKAATAGQLGAWVGTNWIY